jgi:phosphoribosylamine--glycine ligase
LTEAKESLRNMLTTKYLRSNIEESLIEWIELFRSTDGKNYKTFLQPKIASASVKDTGLNTGGMGAVSPVPYVDIFWWKKSWTRIITHNWPVSQKDGDTVQGFVFIDW